MLESLLKVDQEPARAEAPPAPAPASVDEAVLSDLTDGPRKPAVREPAAPADAPPAAVDQSVLDELTGGAGGKDDT